TLPNIQAADVGGYYVVVSQSTGSATSTTALVTIAGVPRITAQPMSIGVARGSTATLSVTATGDSALAYQWWKNGNPIAGATSPTLTLPNIQTTDAGD